MPEDRGGLDYNIDISGAFDQKLDGFIAKVKAFDAQMQTLEKRAKSLGGSAGKTGNAADTKGMKEARVEGEKLTTTEKKLLQLQQQIITLRAKEVNQLQAVRDVTASAAKAEQSRVIALNQGLQATDNLTKASLKQSQIEAKRAQDLIRLNRLRAAGVKDETALAREAGVSVARVRQLLPQYERLAQARSKQAAAAKAQGAAEKATAREVARLEAARAKDAQRAAVIRQRTSERARRDELNALKADILARDKAAKMAERTRASEVSAGKQAISTTEANRIAMERQLRSANELAIKRAQISQLVAQGNISERKAAELVGLSASQAKQLGLNMWDAEHAVRQFLFTFRRLVGILAIFTAARELAAALSRGVKEISRFNAELETAEIGIASILSSVGKVVDKQGNLIDGAEGFSIAMARSREIVQGLKQDAIGSIATFESLVQAYQVAVGPGLAAGLNLEQIPEISKRLAEGAITLGVPLNQLSEEIRSLLQGTATARNTRIAVLFGGAKEANEAIRNAKEQGNLYEVLTEKFQGVKQGADAASLSLNVLKSDLQDAVQILLAEGGIQQFVELKNAILAFKNELTDVDAAGNIIFSPVALGIVQEVATTLASMSKSFRAITNTETALGLVRNTLGTIGTILKAVTPLASAVFQGLIDGANTVLAPVRLVLKLLESVSKALGLQKANVGLSKVVAFLVQGAVALFLWRKSLVAIKALVGVQGLLKFVPAVAIAMWDVVGALRAQQVSLVSINGLTAIWAALTGKVATASALATGGLTLLLGVAALLVVKFGVLDRAIGLFNDELSDADKAAMGLEGGINSAVDATREGAKSAKEWADALKDAQANLAIAEATSGIEGFSKDIIGLIAEETAEFEKQNSSLDTELKKLEERRKILEESVSLAKQTPDDIFFNVRTQLLNPDTPEEAAARYMQSMQEIQGIEVPVDLIAGIDAKKVTENISQAEDELLRVVQKQKSVERERIEARKASLAILQEELRTLIAENSYLEEQKNLNLAEEARKTAQAVNERANVSVKALAAEEANYAIAIAQRDLSEKRWITELNNLDRQIEAKKELVDAGKAEAADVTALTLLEDQRARREQEISAEMETQSSALKSQTTELNRQREIMAGDFTAGAFTAGLFLGLEDFTRELPALGFQLADIVSGALSDLAGTVASVWKDTIDPRTDEDLKTAFGEFFLDLSGQFVEALTNQLIASSINKLGFGAEPISDPLQVEANALQSQQIAALNANTAALNSQGGAGAAGAGTTTASPAVPVGSGGGEDPTASAQGTFLGKLFGGIANASPILLGLLMPILLALIARKAFAKGGKVKGYASGGNVDSIPRPANIPASDTVPAWLTPGEFVIKKDMVKKYGTGLFESLNRGVLNPSSFGKTVAPALHRQRKGVQAFANGGAVTRTSGESRGQSSQVVMPILPVSEKNTDQILSGGRRALANNVNQVRITGDANAKGGW